MNYFNMNECNRVIEENNRNNDIKIKNFYNCRKLIALRFAVFPLKKCILSKHE